jgi:four helix bundle protein
MKTAKLIKHHWELDVYRMSVETAMRIFEMSARFPKEERYSLTDQIRRSSRSVSGQIAEGWRRRKYENVFVNKLNEAEGEAGETQAWIEYTVRCGYLSRKDGQSLHRTYDHIIGKLVVMGNNPGAWALHKTQEQPR